MMLDRRQFLKTAGTGALALGALPPLLECAGIRRRDIPSCESAATCPSLTPEERGILCLASLAPSGHNTQPWTVRKAGNRRWIIGSARNRWLPAVDPENREMLLSIGAFLENISAAAEHFGRRADIRVMAHSGHDPEIAEVTLAPAPGQTSTHILERIRTRRTVRSGHLARELSSSDVARITAADAGGIYFFPLHGREGRFLAEGTIEANRTQAWRNAAQEELSRWIRWTDAEARNHRNGLTPESMEIGGMAGWFVRHFFDRESVLSESFRNKTVEITREQTGSCGGWLILTAGSSSVSSLLETGRRFQRLFLGVREMNIALHPMTQMLEEVPWKDSVASELGLPGTVQFIIRAGYIGRYPGPVSLRMPLERLIAG
ncbi:MAG: twin-arginine translocation signal domain-containing protein [Spirochaetes bacterium]|nr:twin-arginine translocation signal domain-containing protein [Spirochaetota bacterium]